MYTTLFSPMEVGGKRLKNRITMAPLYLGYAGEGGTVSPLLLEHYRMMASGGAAMITVENATVDHPAGSGSNRTIRADTDDNLQGLEKLARAIKDEGSLVCLQINHAGRFAWVEEAVAPSQVNTFGRTPRAMSIEEIKSVRDKFVQAAERAFKAGFDMVELHGGTGYLLAQFASPRSNKRSDYYGGSLEKRMRFPLEVMQAVKDSVGNKPVGYRFLADEWLPDGLTLEESGPLASTLSHGGAAYLSVMGGTYESFSMPEVIKATKKPGYMADLAGEIRDQVSVPVIAAGRIAVGHVAEEVLASGRADLVGLARVLWADPQWPQKVRQDREDDLVICDPGCRDVCLQLVMQGKPAFCPKWSPEKARRLKDLYE